METFKFVVLSSEESRSHAVKALCLVGQDWNEIANGTSDLWTKIAFVHPLHPDQISAAKKWLRASEQKAIDVEIDLRDPAWNELSGEPSHPPGYSARLQSVVAALQGSEHRWGSLSVKSDAWSPNPESLQSWVIPNLPLLESISFQTGSEVLAMEELRHYDQFFGHPTLFDCNGTLMPKLREVSISAVALNWESVAATSFRDLRKLQIKNQCYRDGPDFGQFANLLRASPGLEALDVTGYFPDPRGVPVTQPEAPLIHLQELKHFTLGWSFPGFACDFLTMFQIQESLETLSLADTESGLGVCHGPDWLFTHHTDSSEVFFRFAIIGSKNHSDGGHLRPWISLLKLKTLSVSWVACGPDAFCAFLNQAPNLEEIHLTDVSRGILEGIAAFAESRPRQSPLKLKRIVIRWVWNGGREPADAGILVDILEQQGFQVTVERFTGEGRPGSTPMALAALLDKEGGGRRP